MFELDNWNILDEQPTHWQLLDDQLMMQVQRGNIWGTGSEKVSNIFVHSLKKPQFEAKVNVELIPKRMYEQAGLGIYWDDDNYIKISKEMFNGRLSLVFVKEAVGQPQVLQLIDYVAAEVEFKLVQSANKVSAFYRVPAGIEWQYLGQTQLISGEAQGVMLYTFAGDVANPQSATFSHFELVQQD